MRVCPSYDWERSWLALAICSVGVGDRMRRLCRLTAPKRRCRKATRMAASGNEPHRAVASRPPPAGLSHRIWFANTVPGGEVQGLADERQATIVRPCALPFLTSSDEVHSATSPRAFPHHHYGLLRPCAPHRYSRPRGWSRLRLLPSHRRRDGAQVLTFHTKAWSSFAPPTCRMSLGQSQASPELIPEEGSPPGSDIA